MKKNIVICLILILILILFFIGLFRLRKDNFIEREGYEYRQFFGTILEIGGNSFVLSLPNGDFDNGSESGIIEMTFRFSDRIVFSRQTDVLKNEEAFRIEEKRYNERMIRANGEGVKVGLEPLSWREEKRIDQKDIVIGDEVFVYYFVKEDLLEFFVDKVVLAYRGEKKKEEFVFDNDGPLFGLYKGIVDGGIAVDVDGESMTFKLGDSAIIKKKVKVADEQYFKEVESYNYLVRRASDDEISSIVKPSSYIVEEISLDDIEMNREIKMEFDNSSKSEKLIKEIYIVN